MHVPRFVLSLGIAVATVCTLSTIGRADVAFPIPVPPSEMTVNPITHDIWVTSTGADAVVVIDGTDRSVATIPVADQPRRVLVDPVRNRAWISHAGALVSVVDGASHAVTAIPLPAPTSLALDPHLGLAYAPTPGALALIDADTLAVTMVPTPASGTPVTDASADGLVTLASSFDPDELVYHYDVHRLAGAPPAVVDQASITGDQVVTGFGFDLRTQRAITTLLFGVPLVMDFDDGLFIPPEFFGFGSYSPVPEPTAGRTWVASNDAFTCAGSFVFAFDTETLEQHGTNAFVPCFDRVAVNPATRRAYTSDTSDFGNPSTTVFFIDADTLAVTPHVLAGYQAALRPVVDVAANRLYVTAYRNFPTTANDVVEIEEPVVAAVPLDVAITVDPLVPGLDPVVHFAATSGFAPYPLPIRQIYWQVDVTDGAWSYADAPGPNASATLAGLAPGPHTVHAFATDGQETTTSADAPAPIVGPIVSLEIVVPEPPACSNGVDDDGDGLIDHPADPGCFSAADRRETSGGCGLGAELALLLFALRVSRG